MDQSAGIYEKTSTTTQIRLLVNGFIIVFLGSKMLQCDKCADNNISETQVSETSTWTTR